MAGAVASSVATQWGVKTLVDALSRGNTSAIWAAFIILVAFISGDTLLWRVASWIAYPTFVRVTGDLRKDMFAYLSGHAPGFFSTRPAGAVTSRVAASANAAYAIENMVSWNVLPPLLATLFAVALLGHVSIAMALVLVPVAVAILVLMVAWAASGERLHRSFADRAARVDGELSDFVGNFSLVVSFGATSREAARFDRVVGRELTARRRSLLYLERIRTIHSAVTVLLTLCMVAWSLRLWELGQASPGDVVLVCTLALSVLHATRDLAIALVDTTQHLSRFAEALLALAAPREICDAPHAPGLRGHGAGISFSRVSFGYPGRPPIVQELDLEVGEGKRVAIVGPSGSGKSTLFRLLQRFHDVDDGIIRINEADIRSITQESLRAMIAVVPQEPSLFNRSILENIRYARPAAAMADVERAAAAAGCMEFIERLPQGIYTRVGERGCLLSGGQKQRVAIARAFLKDAPLLLLDEATSALDAASEAAIRSALSRLMYGRTVLAIAHSTDLVAEFDRLVVLVSGRIAWEGHPSQLGKRSAPGPRSDDSHSCARRQAAGAGRTS